MPKREASFLPNDRDFFSLQLDKLKCPPSALWRSLWLLTTSISAAIRYRLLGSEGVRLSDFSAVLKVNA
jgi:hypothetical protein